MNENILELSNYFKKINEMGWIESISKGSSGIGLTFEHLIGKDTDSFEIPDFKGIEIKTKKAYSSSYTTLFNAAPENKFLFETNRLRELYGYPDKACKQFKVLNNDAYANKRNWIGSKFQFLLKVNRDEEKIFLVIFDSSGKIIEKEAHWNFSTIIEKVYRKINYVAFVSADRNWIDDKEYFHYKKISFYKLKNFETFLELIENGKIIIGFKIGVFKSGESIGQTHDHGTGFKLKEEDFELLYDKISL